MRVRIFTVKQKRFFELRQRFYGRQSVSIFAGGESEGVGEEPVLQNYRKCFEISQDIM